MSQERREPKGARAMGARAQARRGAWASMPCTLLSITMLRCVCVCVLIMHVLSECPTREHVHHQARRAETPRWSADHATCCTAWWAQAEGRTYLTVTSSSPE